ncbi:hypothetical protein EMCRGX_G018854 [Ephydatia muelleri]
MVIEMFGSKSGDTIFPTGRVLCKTCHSSVQSIPKLEKKLLDLNQQIREQLRHAGLPYGLTRLPRQERQSVEAPTCTTPPADSSKGIGGSKRSNDTRDPPAKRRCLPFNHSSPKPGSSMNPMIASNGSPVVAVSLYHKLNVPKPGTAYTSGTNIPVALNRNSTATSRARVKKEKVD